LETRLLVGALVADAFETPKEFVWNDAELAPEDGWAGTTADATRALVRSVAECLQEEPILIIVQEGTACEGAWVRLRPLIPCASFGAGFAWVNSPPPQGSPAADLAEAVGKGQANRMFARVQQALSREGACGG
jgi:hypothetical protein